MYWAGQEKLGTVKLRVLSSPGVLQNEVGNGPPKPNPLPWCQDQSHTPPATALDSSLSKELGVAPLW
jgi:hypothetical protein